MQLQVRDRFNPRLQKLLQASIDEGILHKREDMELLAPSQILKLTLWSLLLFIVGCVFFIGLNITVYLAQTHSTSGSIGGWSLVLWLAINLLGGILILGIHEGLHGLAFWLWGGIPHFGAKLPYALYCGAKNQLFHRNQYLVVGLAPFVVITLAAVLFIFLSPALASYALLAAISNFSGAAGDLWVAAKILRLPPSVLIEDTETGYHVWEIARD